MAAGTKRLTRKQAARYIRRYFGSLSDIRSQTLMRRCTCLDCPECHMADCRCFTDVQDGDIESRDQIGEFVAGHSNFQLWRN